MEIAKGFKIAVASTYPEYWRYNVALMCGCFDGEDRRTGFASAESTVAPVGANLPAPPEAYASPRTTVLETPQKPIEEMLADEKTNQISLYDMFEEE